ncbi:hypothetical protein [Actinokineospora globicatena]|uniref:hypothetical protein n=1 Tax=Actinokineospora globicatena TaxID=103729 RepID=UPI0020A4AFA5|nr:hypothetical protein [Actinokineospora globicatena]GLW79643.1 hypothetical protein Aglo01_41240 [Actinokineospora globicatena]GLW85947.1 hypothetical protein Aglo02_35870 [Actinokineospora globicatena]
MAITEHLARLDPADLADRLRSAEPMDALWDYASTRREDPRSRLPHPGRPRHLAIAIRWD